MSVRRHLRLTQSARTAAFLRCGPFVCCAFVFSLALAACQPAELPPDPPVCQLPLAVTNPTPTLQCGPTLDFTPINSYQGELTIVQAREGAVVLLNGTCTGTLIAAAAGPVVLTAGHCFGLGDMVVVSFNFEDAPDGEPLITGGTVIERSESPDYELLQLDALPADAMPTPLGTQPGDRLAIIQHPRGSHKVIAEGTFLDSCNGLIYYTDLDTLVGSSGAGILNRQGYLVGIHTDGNCTTDGRGSNRGATVASIVEASQYLASADIAQP